MFSAYFHAEPPEDDERARVLCGTNWYILRNARGKAGGAGRTAESLWWTWILCSHEKAVSSHM